MSRRVYYLAVASARMDQSLEEMENLAQDLYSIILCQIKHYREKLFDSISVNEPETIVQVHKDLLQFFIKLHKRGGFET